MKIKTDSIPVSSFSYDQAVILNIQLVDEAKESDNYQSIIEIENTIKKVLPLKYGIDGHEFGEGECTMYIYGPDANKLWVLVEPVLKLSEFSRIEVTLQYGMPNDPKTKDKSFTL